MLSIEVKGVIGKKSPHEHGKVIAWNAEEKMQVVLHEAPSKHLTRRSSEMSSEKRKASFPVFIILEDELASSPSAHDVIDVRFADPPWSPHSFPHPRVLAHDYTTRSAFRKDSFFIIETRWADVNSSSVPLFKEINCSSVFYEPATATGQRPHPVRGRYSCSAPPRQRHPCPGCRRAPSRTSGGRCRTPR